MAFPALIPLLGLLGRGLLSQNSATPAPVPRIAPRAPVRLPTGGMTGGWPPGGTPPFAPHYPGQTPGYFPGNPRMPNAGAQSASMSAPQPSRMPMRSPFGNPTSARFPRLQSVMERIRDTATNLTPVQIGLLSTMGERPVGHNWVGEAFDVAGRIQDSRSREELIRRELEEMERRRQAGSSLNALIQSLSTGSEGAPPVLSAQQARVISTAAQNDPNAAMQMLAKVPGLLAPVPGAELSETGEKLRDVSGVLGRDLTEREALTLAGAGQLFEASEDETDEPLSPTDLQRIRRPDGSTFELGTTFGEAQEAGAKVYSEAELKQQRDVSRALNTLDTLEQMAVGEDGVFRDQGGSILTNNVLGRLASGVANGLGSLLGTEASVRRDVFTDTAQGSISSLVRSLGEVGSLSDGDVRRALALIPELGSTPDTEEKARAKLTELRRIISRGVDSSGGSTSTGSTRGVRFLGYE